MPSGGSILSWLYWADDVAVPRWLLLFAAVFALVALVDRLLLPALRWALKRRSDRNVEDINARLRLRIQPFKLARRKALIDQLRFDPDVLAAIETYAAMNGVPRSTAIERARRYAAEIVPAFSTTTYFSVGTRLARWVSRALYRVRLGYTDKAALRAVDPNAAVVFVINHRSNMDYVVVTYIASPAAALSYAVGEWAQIWPLNRLIRSMGAYFIRRNSNDPLYRRMVARYVAMATHAGVVQAVFPEGGLSRDGHLKSAKLGLISYLVQGFDPNGARDLVFIPVGINYDRVLEDRNLTAAASLAPGEQPRFKFSPGVFIAYIAKMLGRMATGRWHRNGYACVAFGSPVSLRDYLAAEKIDLRVLDDRPRQEAVARFGERLTAAIGRAVPALPVPLVATALLQAPPTGLTLFELKGRVAALIDTLESRGHYVHIPRTDRDYAIDGALRILRMRHLVVEGDGVLAANAREVAVLRYYANSIGHQLSS